MKKLLIFAVALTLLLGTIPASGAQGLEPVTFTVYYVDSMAGVSPGDKQIMKDYAEAHKGLGVTINWVSLGDPSVMAERISILFSSGDYGDAIFGNPLQESDVSLLSSQGILQPLNSLITQENTPNLYTFFEKVPSAKAISTLPDGNFYTLPRYNGNPGDYLESPIWINKTWLDKLSLAVPATVEEFETVLKAFRDGDPNGNGLADEIPLMLFNGDSFRHMEAWLGIFGIPTKDNNFDSYVYVQDGKVTFAPVQETYKTAIKWLASLYKEKLIYQDMFTTTLETVTAKLSGEAPVVGVVTTKTMGKFSDQYVQILPPTAEGYATRWFYHPGSLGIKNFFSVTDACKAPERLLNYFDDMWTTEQTLINNYGPIGEVLIQKDGGTFGFQTPPNGLTLAEYQLHNTLGVFFVLYKEDFGTKFEMSAEDATKKASYDLYYDILNKEIWPRPYLAPDLVTRASELRTDIFNTVGQMKAMWVTGQSNIDADWDTYLGNLKKMGIDEFVSLYQQAYDSYAAAFK